MAIINIIDKLREAKTLSIFKHAAGKNPFYKNYLEKSGINAKSVRTIGDFKKRVPTLNKSTLFPSSPQNITNYCMHGNLNKCRIIFPSSGFSGKFSFGLISKEDIKAQLKVVNSVLDRVFNVSKHKTLLINCLSMGINIPASNVTMVNTGLRNDVALSIIRTFAKEFEQIILMGENIFIKNLLEHGAELGIKWSDHKIYIVFGGESFPESFRAYLEHLLGVAYKDKDDFVAGSSFGFAEIGLNVLWESRGTIFMRKKAVSDKDFRKALLEEEAVLSPILFIYNPLSVFVEEEKGKLLFTTLNRHTQLPIIRYETGDEGHIISYKKITELLREFGMDTSILELPLPVVAVKNRGHYLKIGDRKIYPDMIKDAFYSITGLPELITGYFRMTIKNNFLNIEIQLKKDKSIPEVIKKNLEDYLKNSLITGFELVFYDYSDFPYAMELDFERKFQYLS